MRSILRMPCENCGVRRSIHAERRLFFFATIVVHKDCSVPWRNGERADELASCCLESGGRLGRNDHRRQLFGRDVLQFFERGLVGSFRTLSDHAHLAARLEWDVRLVCDGANVAYFGASGLAFIGQGVGPWLGGFLLETLGFSRGLLVFALLMLTTWCAVPLFMRAQIWQQQSQKAGL